jgi:hypothetical protein
MFFPAWIPWAGLLLVPAPGQAAPEQRAVAFLVREVPRWSRENKCYSCHNNGDAARALYTAMRLGYAVPKDALRATTAWLSRPEVWDKNKGDPAYSDKRLSRLQFTLALLDAADAGVVKNVAAVQRAADLVAGEQQADGSWPISKTSSVGSPVNYGVGLATYLARLGLARADADRFAKAIGGADEWLRRMPINNVFDAAVTLLALDGDITGKRGQRALELIRKAQAKDGGWGPDASSPSEPFDTALVLLALRRGNDDGVRKLVRRGRAFLIATQQQDGGWPETTRPPGAQSYAQRISTSAWATLALLATTDKKP